MSSLAEQYANEAAQRVREADDKASRSRAAFATGRFGDYLQAEVDEAKARLDAMYGEGTENSNGGDGGESGGDASESLGSGVRSWVGGPPEDVGGEREARS